MNTYHADITINNKFIGDWILDESNKYIYLNASAPDDRFMALNLITLQNYLKTTINQALQLSAQDRQTHQTYKYTLFYKTFYCDFFCS